MHEEIDLENDNKTIRAELRNDPTLKSLLERMPDEVKESFTEVQLSNLKIALAARSWGKHAIDFRSTVSFFSHRYYYVFLAGRNRRELTRSEKRMGMIIQSVLLTIFVSFCTLLGLLVLYLAKSALGIDMFPDFSLGIWSWFKENILG